MPAEMAMPLVELLWRNELGIQTGILSQLLSRLEGEWETMLALFCPAWLVQLKTAIASELHYLQRAISSVLQDGMATMLQPKPGGASPRA